jgi:hypothetical protein
MKKQPKFDRVFYACPGAWTGYAPGNMSGLITVDAKKIREALQYISRHYTITQTYIPENPHTSLRGAVYVGIIDKQKSEAPHDN